MLSHHFLIGQDYLTIETLYSAIKDSLPLRLSPQSLQNTEGGYQFLHKKIEADKRPFYGINTGFGSLCNIRISDSEISTLQDNLVRSHACGIGDEVPSSIVKVILFLKIQSLAYGYSGISPTTLERLIQMYNDEALPVIYQLGSLGASGDLAPLAHLSLPLIGEGEVYFKNKKIKASEYLQEKGLSPLKLEAKEGLALLNGTQFSTGYAATCLIQAQRLMRIANCVAAMSIDAFFCKTEPFDEKLHKIRPHQGQVQVAAAIRKHLEGSPIAQQEKTSVQDPYAFRCVPQVHGASWDTFHFVEKTILTEINSVTDNPTIFSEADEILSGGNFHAQPIALALDFLAIALAELGSISERRIFQLVSGQRDLPVYLTKNGGLQSGMMIAQYTAASVASQNKQLCTPASVDSIVSSNGQEDHVSMAANAATKCYRVVENVERILAIEMMIAMQALDFRQPLKSSEEIENIKAKYRQFVPTLKEDVILHNEILKTITFLKDL